MYSYFFFTLKHIVILTHNKFFILKTVTILESGGAVLTNKHTYLTKRTDLKKKDRINKQFRRGIDQSKQ